MFGFLKKKKKSKEAESQAPEENSEEKKDDSAPQPEAKPAGEEKKEDENQIDESKLSEKEKEKLDKLKNIKSKISRILQSSDIEIVDENEGDDYESEAEGSSDIAKQQQDYDILKAKFGKGNKDKKEEVTLTIDDFDFTYVGKYVDEYDLIHMKNIKRIKLPNKHKKLIKRLILATSIIIALSVAGIVGYNMTKAKPEVLVSVSLSQKTQKYFENESFDFTGLYLTEVYSTGRINVIDLSESNYRVHKGGYASAYKKTGGVLDRLIFTGKSNVTIYFQHGGFGMDDNYQDLIMNITVLKKEEKSITVKYSNGIFDLQGGDVINSEYLIPLIDYENYNSNKISLDSSNLKVIVDGRTLLYNKNLKGFELPEGVNITKDSIINIRYDVVSTTETKTFQTTLVYGANSMEGSRIS